MTPDQLLAHFDRISEAPDAISCLRQFILSLAVRGKLLSQRSTDDSAEKLLGDRCSVVDPDKVPWILPCGWKWSSLKLLGETVGGGTPSKTNPEYWDGVIPWVSPKDMKVDRIRDAEDHITDEAIENSSTRLIPPGALLFVVRGMILVHSFPAAITEVPVTINQDMKAVVPFIDGIVPMLLLLTKGLKPEILQLVERSTHGTCKLLTNKLFEFPLPIPPLAEQRRIVAKVDELMALCDQLEAAQAERERRRDRLAAASLARLNQSADASRSEEFRNHVRFHFDHLPRLTTRPEQIPAIRETILNLAFRGHLVEPSVIENDADAYATQLAISKEPPFPIPQAWAWREVGTFATLINGDRSKKYPNKTEYVPNGIPFINTGHIRPNGRLCTVSMNYLSRAKYESLGSGKITRGDLVYCLRGATLGKTAIVDQYDEGAIASSLVIIRLKSAVSSRYMYYCLVSPFGRSLIKQYDNGTAQPNLAADSVRSYQIPLPPLPEQHRIVAKVDELMAICDELESQLTTAETQRRRLLEAILHEALEPATADALS